MADTKVQELAIQRAVQLLKASGASFKVIWYDKEFGDLEVKPKKTPRPGEGSRRAIAEKEGRKYGDLKAHYWPLVKDMQPGDVVVVPLGKFRKDVLQKAISGGLAHAWGSGSHMVAQSEAGVEVLRVK